MHTSDLSEDRIDEDGSILPVTGVVGIVFIASAGILAVIVVFRLRDENFVVVETEKSKKKTKTAPEVIRAMKIENRNINRILELQKLGKLKPKRGRKKKSLK